MSGGWIPHSLGTDMIIRPLLAISSFALVFGSWNVAQADTPSLKDAYKRDFLIGSALGSPGSYSARELELITSQFDTATPEVCMKPRPIHPQENVWRFEQADAFVSFCEQHHIVPFGHTLVWHEDCPDWFFQDGDKPASRQLVLSRLKNHIRTILMRYKGRLRGFDVVNEAISDNPKDFFRKTKWLQSIGDDYVVQAFRFAQEADPTIDLQYNDYNIESEPKRSKAIKLIQDLQRHGIHVAAIGIQGHWSLDHVPYADIETAIAAFAHLGVKVMITELDMDVLPRKHTGADAGRRETGRTHVQAAPAPADVLKREADQYARLFTLFHKHRDVITRVTFWGIDDGRTWLNGWPYPRYNHPLLFDRECHPKPAFFAVINVASE